MKQIFIILLCILPLVASAQEVKTTPHKKAKKHSLAKGYLSGNYLSQTYRGATDLNTANGYSVGLGVKRNNSNDLEKIGFRLGIEYCMLSNTYNVRDYVTGGMQKETYKNDYIKPGASLVMDRHIIRQLVFHADAGVNFWFSGNSNKISGSAVAGVGLGLKWCILRLGYDYGLGNIGDALLPVHANTLSIGLIIYPTGMN